MTKRITYPTPIAVVEALGYVLDAHVDDEWHTRNTYVYGSLSEMTELRVLIHAETGYYVNTPDYVYDSCCKFCLRVDHYYGNGKRA